MVQVIQDSQEEESFHLEAPLERAVGRFALGETVGKVLGPWVKKGELNVLSPDLYPEGSPRRSTVFLSLHYGDLLKVKGQSDPVP